MTIGLLGVGWIGRRIARPLQGLGATVVGHDPYLSQAEGLPELLGFEELLSTADVISLHLPLTDETRGIIDHHALDLMKDGALLVNTSRGPLVDLQALTAALVSGKLAGAGLDVFETEPADPVVIDGVPNLIATPHMAYYSEQSLEESQRKAATQVVKVLTGSPPDYQVN